MPSAEWDVVFSMSQREARAITGERRFGLLASRLGCALTATGAPAPACTGEQETGRG